MHAVATPPALAVEAPVHGVYVKPDKPRTSKLAIVGFCESSRNATPYDDPEMEFWSLNKGYIFQQKIDRHFEMHGPGIYRWPIRRPAKHEEWMKAFPGPIYMHEADPEIPNSVAYPLEAIAEFIGQNIWRLKGPGEPLMSAGEDPYLTSTIAYQIALAMYEGYPEIHLYGIDLNTDGEYVWQKSGVEYLLGQAAARGHKVVLPDNCPLLRKKLYGRGFLKSEGEAITVSQYETHLLAIRQQREGLTQHVNRLVGAKKELEYTIAQGVPGLDPEMLDARQKEMAAALDNGVAKANQLVGEERSCLYWISTTPDGQDGIQAIQQLKDRANGHPPSEAVEVPKALVKRSQKLKAKMADGNGQLAQSLGARDEAHQLTDLLPPGLEKEKLDHRLKQHGQIADQLAGQLMQLDGGLHEVRRLAGQNGHDVMHPGAPDDAGLTEGSLVGVAGELAD